MAKWSDPLGITWVQISNSTNTCEEAMTCLWMTIGGYPGKPVVSPNFYIFFKQTVTSNDKLYIDYLTRMAISYEIYKTRLRGVS